MVFIFDTIKTHKVKPSTTPLLRPFSSEGLPIFFNYRKDRYDATLIHHNKIIYLENYHISLSVLSVEITGTVRNGWRDWNI